MKIHGIIAASVPLSVHRSRKWIEEVTPTAPSNTRTAANCEKLLVNAVPIVKAAQHTVEAVTEVLISRFSSRGKWSGLTQTLRFQDLQ